MNSTVELKHHKAGDAQQVRPCVLIVDDEPANLKLLGQLLAPEGYEVQVARSGEQAMKLLRERLPNIMLLDVVMEGMSGYDVCREVRDCEDMRALPIILVTGARPEEEKAHGLDAGADEFLTKPVVREDLLARARALLRVDAMHRQMRDWNHQLEDRVAEQVREMQKLDQLRNFLPTHVADLVAEGDQSLLSPRRRKITGCFLDLQGFMEFAETAEPEEVMEVLGDYYQAVGDLAEKAGGTVEHFEGSGISLLFNAPMKMDNHEAAAVQFLMDLHDDAEELINTWEECGYELRLQLGAATGYASVGVLGFGGRSQYCANGAVMTLARKVCGKSEDGQVVVDEKTLDAIASLYRTESLGEHQLKGFSRPVQLTIVSEKA